MLTEIRIREEDNILIIVPHADDESIGMGGFLSFYGSKCTIWLLTDGSKCQTDKGKEEIVKVRKNEFAAAMGYFGVANVNYFDISDRSLIVNTDILMNQEISKFTKIFIPSSDETHIDHYSAHIAAIKMITQNMSKAEVYMYEITCPMHLYNYYIDITSVIDKKLQGINIYESQVKVFDYANAALSLNCFRACMQGLKNSYIEVFNRIYKSCCVDGNVLEKYKFAKMERHAKLLEKWLKIELDNYHLADYLLMNKITELNIYGYGFWGKKIEQAIKGTGIDLIKVYDKKFVDNSGVYVSFSPETLNDKPVIISVSEGIDSIKKMLNNNGYKKVIILEDLLDDMEVFRNDME